MTTSITHTVPDVGRLKPVLSIVEGRSGADNILSGPRYALDPTYIPEMITPSITTVILAGGKGIRIGGNKGLQLLHGKALIDWVLDAIRPHSDEILINANANTNDYEKRGYRIITDHSPEHAGPLAGLQAALHGARHGWLACVPCDTPFLPDNLIHRLCSAITPTTEVVVAVADGQRQPTIALYRKSVLPKLDAYLDSGARKAGDWLHILDVSEVVFENAVAFANINSLEELAVANRP